MLNILIKGLVSNDGYIMYLRDINGDATGTTTLTN